MIVYDNSWKMFPVYVVLFPQPSTKPYIGDLRRISTWMQSSVTKQMVNMRRWKVRPAWIDSHYCLNYSLFCWPQEKKKKKKVQLSTSRTKSSFKASAAKRMATCSSCQCVQCPKRAPKQVFLNSFWTFSNPGKKVTAVVNPAFPYLLSGPALRATAPKQ